MKVLVLIIVLISINSYAMADNKMSIETNDKYYLTLKGKYTEINEQITASLNSAKAIVDKIIDYHKKINETVKEEEDIKIKYKNNKDKRNNALEKLETVRNQIHLKYKDIASSIEFIYKGGDFWNISQQKFTTDRRKLSSVIDKWIKKYSENKFEACFKDKTYVNTPACEELKTSCSKKWLYGLENKFLYYNKVTPEFEISSVYIADPISDDPKHKNAKLDIDDQYELLFCGLISFTDEIFSPAGIDTMAMASTNNIMKLSSFVYPSEDSLSKLCIDDAPSRNIVNNLIDLYLRYPTDYTIKWNYDHYIKWQSQCNSVVQSVCQDSYVIKDTVVLTYITVACEARDVTEKDVKNDVPWMPTEAEKLKHSTLLDTLDVCHKAYLKGYSWRYLKPMVPSDCKAKKKQK